MTGGLPRGPPGASRGLGSGSGRGARGGRQLGPRKRGCQSLVLMLLGWHLWGWGSRPRWLRLLAPQAPFPQGLAEGSRQSGRVLGRCFDGTSGPRGDLRVLIHCPGGTELLTCAQQTAGGGLFPVTHQAAAGWAPEGTARPGHGLLEPEGRLWAWVCPGHTWVTWSLSGKQRAASTSVQGHLQSGDVTDTQVVSGWWHMVPRPSPSVQERTAGPGGRAGTGGAPPRPGSQATVLLPLLSDNRVPFHSTSC